MPSPPKARLRWKPSIRSCRGASAAGLSRSASSFFALSTILGWSYYGDSCIGYLSGNRRAVRLVYKIVFILVCIPGAAGSGTLMWDIADTLNGLMALPNLVALIPMAGTVAELTQAYFGKTKKLR